MGLSGLPTETSNLRGLWEEFEPRFHRPGIDMIPSSSPEIILRSFFSSQNDILMLFCAFSNNKSLGALQLV